MPRTDDQFMSYASRLSRQNLGICWPNPCVGAVIVAHEGEPVIVGTGVTQPGGRPHAERVALQSAGSAANGATLYVTLEPCSHHGKSPPCTDALIEAGVGKVVYACKDPDPRVAGSGIARLRDAGIVVEYAPQTTPPGEEPGNQGHLKRTVSGKPFVQLKLAVGSDGRISPGSGSPVWVTGELARKYGHLLRARADAILVGKGTVLADNPSLTCRLPGLEVRSPVRVILDTTLQTPRDAEVLTSAQTTPTWLFSAENLQENTVAAITAMGAKVIPVESCSKTARLSLDRVLTELGTKGITRLLVEGGPTVARSMIDADYVDEIFLFMGPNPAGANSIEPLLGATVNHFTDDPRYRRTASRPLGEDRLTIYRRNSREDECSPE